MSIYPTLAGLLFARLLLAISPAAELLKDDHQLTSPLNAYPRLREGVYLFQNNIDPYSGGTFRHSPLFLSFFSWLPDSPYFNVLLWTSLDVVAAYALASIWRERSQGNHRRTILVVSAYLANPYLFLPSVASATSVFDNALLLLSLKFAAERRTSPSLFALAVAAHLSLPSILLLPAILLLLASSPHSRLACPQPFSGDLRKACYGALEFAGYFVGLAVASTTVAGGIGWISNTWGAGFLLPDLTPNPGMWWYFFTEMFDDFRSFFLMVFSTHLLIYIAPICIAFQHDPLYAAFLLTGVIATFKPYPTLADMGLFLSMMTLFPETYPHLRYPVVTALLHLHAFLLLPLFHYLWVGAGTGNANFFYASSLVFGLANGGVLLDMLWAGLRTAVGDLGDKYTVVQE